MHRLVSVPVFHISWKVKCIRNHSHMWPLTQKRSLRLAVLRRIAVQRPFSSRSNGIGYCSNVRAIRSKKLASVPTVQAIRSKKIASVRTVRAIRSKKFVSRLNSSSYPFQKICIRSNGSSYPFQMIRQLFERFELSVLKLIKIIIRQPFKRLGLSV